eukprot:365325-Chlamydomonas_euryale.AAC.36
MERLTAQARGQPATLPLCLCSNYGPIPCLLRAASEVPTLQVGSCAAASQRRVQGGGSAAQTEPAGRARERLAAGTRPSDVWGAEKAWRSTMHDRHAMTQVRRHSSGATLCARLLVPAASTPGARAAGVPGQPPLRPAMLKVVGDTLVGGQLLAAGDFASVQQMAGGHACMHCCSETSCAGHVRTHMHAHTCTQRLPHQRTHIRQHALMPRTGC